MARGRNQNRGHNHQVQNTQLKIFPLNQKQQQQQTKLLPQSVSVHKQTNTKVSNTTATAIASTPNIFANAPVANINKQSCSNCQKSNNKETNTTNHPPSINCESYGHNNKTSKTCTNENKSNNNKNYDSIHLEDLNTHLEKTDGDPAVSSSTKTTYQMTMSNNSCENFSQVKTNTDDDDDSSIEDHHNDDAVLFAAYTHSASESDCESELNNGYNQEHVGPIKIINRSPVIEQNVSVIASVPENSDASDKRLTATQNGNSLNGQLNNLTVYHGDNLLKENQEQHNFQSPNDMGQKNTKGGDATHTHSSKSCSPTQTTSSSGRSLRESSVSSATSLTSQNENNTGYDHSHERGQSPSIHVPTITVEDCSSVGSQQAAKSYDSNKTDEFYDFETETSQQQQLGFSDHNNEDKEQENIAGKTSATQKANSSYGIQRTASPTSMYSRYNYIKLEDVEEEDEEEDLEEEEVHEDSDADEEHEEDEEEQHNEQLNDFENAKAEQRHNFKSNNNLDSEYRQQNNSTHSNSSSPERLQRQQQQQQQQQQQHQLNIESTFINISNSNNSSDCNLSTSFPDSGMGESLSSTSTNSRYINSNETDCESNSSRTMKQQEHKRQIEQHMQQQQQQQQEHQHTPFVRDGYSTDCDETLMQCDDLFLDFAETPDNYLDPTTSERLVCIESISLPDVVVESTNSNNATSTNNNYNAAATSLLTPSSLSCNSLGANSGIDRDYININGATGATLNSVHFIPIHVEGSSSSSSNSNNNNNNNVSINSSGIGGGSGSSSPRKQSVDDSLVGSSRATIEIIEDATELHHTPASTRTTKNNSDIIADELKKELVEQKAQFNVQLKDAHKNVNSLQTKISEMQIKIEKLEQELSAKTWNVERLQGELNAAHKDDEYVRKKLKLLEDEKTNLRHRFSESEDELKRKYDDLEIQYNELQEKYKQTQSLASNLHTQLAQAQTEAEEWREEVNKIRIELEEQIRILQNSLENSENERKICEDKWQREFEMLRTHNMDREESIMTDCEWQLRQMQKQWKDRYDKAESGRREAVEKVEDLEEEIDHYRREIDDLKIYQNQVTSLRGVVNEQELSIQNLVSQIEHLKGELAVTNANLAEQIEAVKKIKYHCDNALYDKDRQMQYRIDEVRHEAASFWEDKLYTEMTRLKNELESVYVEERREALDKLQAEHIEELKALTNRYTDNEEELREELIETQRLLEQKAQEFIELREKSDNTLLQTRMHLDRADREFQKAMCQEEERREALEKSLREEFEQEKLDMEAKFRERLGQVKDEFAKELQNSAQALRDEHIKEIEKLTAKMQTEKDEALQALSEKHRKKLADVDEKIKEIEQSHKNDLKDLKAAYDAEKVALDKRDISNANEIEQLHRKCRCLTNLFEEMRMRYERRDPRQEDLREIAELRARCESQERDLYLLTDRLREMQIQMNEMQRNGEECNAMNNKNNKKSKQIKKPPPKTIPTNCDVIYEENEERESPPPPPPPPTQNSMNTNKKLHVNNKHYNITNDNNSDDDNESQQNEETTTVHHQVNNIDSKEQRKHKHNQPACERKSSKLLIKDSEDDSHMITAV